MTGADGEILVKPVVDALFEKLEHYVIPYLREYVEYISKKKVTTHPLNKLRV